jgi:phosphoglycolate phosphatase-like HAD superfamily hydrolase
MDGLLIDSEDKYTRCTNEILAKYGKAPIPWNVKAQLQGRPGTDAMDIFLEVCSFYMFLLLSVTSLFHRMMRRNSVSIV